MLEAKNYKEELSFGKGAFGNAFIFRDLKTGKRVAVKQIAFADEQELENAQKEVDIMKDLKSDFIVQCFGSYVKDHNFCIVMHYCEQGDLQKFINKNIAKREYISEEKFFDFAAQLACGLEYIRKKRILHRDLKPGNIFISGRGRLKIGDFGISKKMDEEEYANTVVGTRIFLSPEMMKSWTYTEKVDMWAFGIILYYLAENKYPFDCSNEASIVLSIAEQDPAPFKNLKNPVAQNLILKLLTKDPSQRWSTEDILNIPEIKQHVDNFNSSDFTYSLTMPFTLSSLLNTTGIVNRNRFAQTFPIQRENVDSNSISLIQEQGTSQLLSSLISTAQNQTSPNFQQIQNDQLEQ
ncbi:MAG: putative NEK protein kinase [Streblomastix strix]|uniref:non-specific serine/threonine protein kinase n=1 Tax=Streblomastix strix TaxID=222440 RepID=A0A5J4VV19_9EUKA|nr:MAG: putative NEK protein kinase [Streblomastix strix]